MVTCHFSPCNNVSLPCRYGDDLHTLVVEIEAHSPIVTAKPHKFTAEPAVPTEEARQPVSGGPTVYGAIKSALLQDQSRISSAGSGVIISDRLMEDIKRKTDQKLNELYPSALQYIVHYQLVGSSIGGRLLSNTCSKFADLQATKAHTEIQVPCLVLLLYDNLY